jgi:hypothetical protein
MVVSRRKSATPMRAGFGMPCRAVLARWGPNFMVQRRRVGDWTAARGNSSRVLLGPTSPILIRCLIQDWQLQGIQLSQATFGVNWSLIDRLRLMVSYADGVPFG